MSGPRATEARIAALSALGDLFAGRMSHDEYWEMYESAVNSRDRRFAQQYRTATAAITRVLEGRAV